MRESIHKYFKLGTLLWMSWPITDPIDALRHVARDDFFDVIELKTFGEKNEEAKNIIAQSHMDVCYSCQPLLLDAKLNPNDLDELKRQEAEDLLLKSIDDAEYFGSKGIAFLSGKWEADRKDDCYAQLIKTTSNVCKYAKSKDMNVELEVFDYDMDKAALIGPAPYAAQFASDIRTKYENFGLLVDLSHIPTTHETSSFVIKTLRPYITHFHYGNAVVKEGYDAYGDKHPRFGYPNSANDIKELVDYLRIIKEEGFFNADDPIILSMEVTLRPGEDEGIILANTKRCLNRAWALLED